MKVSALSDVLGAEVLDADASSPSEALMSELRSALSKHRMLAVRSQQMDANAVFKFASALGPVEMPSPVQGGGYLSATNFVKNGGNGVRQDVLAVHGISNLDRDGNPTSNPPIRDNYIWHTDKQHMPSPAFATVLYAQELPPSGGDTQFINMCLAYEALPQNMKKKLHGLRVEHSWRHMREQVSDTGSTDEENKKMPPVIHPLVRTLPESGNKCLYLGAYASHVVDMPKPESDELLTQLMEHALQEKFMFVYKWQLGDLVFWDNRCLMHRAIRNFDMNLHRRVLLRAVVSGSPPQ